MSGWPTKTLGSLVRLVNGKAFTEADWSRAGLPIIRIQNLNDATKPFNYWSGPLDRQVLVRTGDLLLAWSGTPGTSFGAHVWNGGRAVLNQHIFRVDLADGGVDRDWLLLAINEQLDEMIGRAHGAVGLRHVTRGEVEQLEIPLPPLQDQRRIAAQTHRALAAVARARAAAEAGMEAAEALERAWLGAAFHGFTPLSAGPSKVKPPTGWRWRSLGEVARLESGHTPSRRHPEWWGGEIRWLALPDIRALDGSVALETLEHTNPDGIENSAARVLPTGTVVLSRTASVGFVTILGREMATSQDFFNWVCGPEIEPRFLMHLLRASRNYIRGLASGAVHKTVYMPAAESFQVCVPSREEQGKIAKMLDQKLEARSVLLARLSAEAEEFEALPAALLRRAFRGEL